MFYRRQDYLFSRVRRSPVIHELIRFKQIWIDNYLFAIKNNVHVSGRAGIGLNMGFKIQLGLP